VASVWFEGLDDLNGLAVDLGRAGPVTAVKVQRAVDAGSARIQGLGQGFAPVDTGNLRSSITRTVGVLAAEVGPTANYGLYVEVGTSRMAPSAYMGPAFDQVAPDFYAAVAQAADPLGGG
jgi:HK97 gp10 family phage protein